ncbi:MAG TPA: aminopeptidase P N-terminal domain-containing protein [Candidatus Binataceae bacterium]|nr:aminopeptidase P N-terminal domain-containing protein [Candidatus Binataceae bacterium]
MPGGGSFYNGRVIIPAEVFSRRRKHFSAGIEGGMAILPSAPVAVRSNDVDYIYRQDSDFHYLTGFPEPEAVAVFAPGYSGGEYILFVRPRDRERETWTGRRAGVEGAKAQYGADAAYPIEQLEDLVLEIMARVDRVYYSLGANEAMNQRVLAWMRRCQSIRPRSGMGASALMDPRGLIHEMRLFKEPDELAAMRQAIRISEEAHRRAMREARGGMMEWEVEAAIDYIFRARGGSGAAYPSIVASGINATTLHYINNDRQMERGELLLVDAGSEYECYASDITRTFPINARYSGAQRELYQLVLDAQRAGIEAVKPGATVDDPHQAALRVLVDGMVQLKLLQGTVEQALIEGSYRRFYMHRTSHWLGLDVHDVGSYRKDGQPRQLEPGMVLTVEPGIYVRADDEEAPASMRGIGIRIEDDVLVREQGCEVLTAAIPKSMDEVEALTQ